MIYNFETDKEKIMLMLNEHQYWDPKTIVFTNGCFDVFHSGHVKLLNESKALGDRLIVGLNSDKSVRMLKGEGRPINNEEERALILDGVGAVDDVIIFNDYSVLDLIKFIKPNIITKGGDYTKRKLEKVGGAFMKEIGGKLIIIPVVKDKTNKKISTSSIIKNLKNEND